MGATGNTFLIHVLNACISISMIVLHVKKLVEIGLIRMILIYLLEIRVSQNLAKLGEGGGYKGWEDRRDMK